MGLRRPESALRSEDRLVEFIGEFDADQAGTLGGGR